MFTTEEFEQACKELDGPDLEGWEFFTESHGVKIYRQYNSVSGLYSYKVYGTIDVKADVCAEVYMDTEYRKEWDSYVKDLSPVQDGNKKGIYWQVNFPFPMSNRDYVYLRELRELDHNGRHMWVILSRSEPFETVPEKSGVIRVTDYLQSLAITTSADGKTQAYMHYYDNPGGMIPSWVINWAAKTGVPNFLEGMQKACRGYSQYQNKRSS